MAANNNWNNWNNLPGNAPANNNNANMQVNAAAPPARGIMSRVMNYFQGSPQERLWYALMTVYGLSSGRLDTKSYGKPVLQREVREAISVISDPEVKPFLNKPADPSKMPSLERMHYGWGAVEPLLIGLGCQVRHPQLLHALIEHGAQVERLIKIKIPVETSVIRHSVTGKKEFPIFLIDSVDTILLAFQHIPAPFRYQMISPNTNESLLVHIAKRIMVRKSPMSDHIKLKSLFEDVLTHSAFDVNNYPFMLKWVIFSNTVRDKTILLQVLTLLHQAGADPNIPDPNSNETAIMRATTPELYDWFITHGANPMATTPDNNMNVMIRAITIDKDPALIGHILARSPETMELLLKPSHGIEKNIILLSDMIQMITTRHDLIDFISTIIETIGPNHGHVMTELIILLFSDSDLLAHDRKFKIDPDEPALITLTDAVRLGKIKESDWKRLRAQALGALADRENVSMIEGTCFYPHHHDLETGCISEDSINVYVESKYPEISDADKLDGIPCMVPSCPKKLLSSELSAMMGDRAKWKQLRPKEPNKVTFLSGLNQTINAHDAILFDKPVKDPKGFGMIHQIGMCPFCLEPVNREEGCIYMTHENTRGALTSHSPYCNPRKLVQSLQYEYNEIAKRSLSANNLLVGIAPNVTFCIECGGPAVSHQHFTVEHPIRVIKSLNYGTCPLGGRRHLLARVLAVRDVYRNRPAALEDPMVERERAARAAQAAIQDPTYLARADAIMEKMKAYQEAEGAFNQNKSNARKQAKNAAEKALVWNYPLPTGVTYNHPNYKVRNEELKREEEKKEPSQNVALASMAKNNEMSSSSSSERIKASRKSNSNNNNNNRGKRYKTMHKRNNRNNQNNQGNQNAMNGGRRHRIKRTRRNRHLKTT